MLRSVSRAPELILPAASWTALRRALADEIGADAAARVLQNTGYAAGDAFYSLLTTGAAADAAGGEGGTLAGTGQTTFWQKISEMFAARGWGHLSHEHVHPGIGALEAGDWGEADPANGAARPSCYFTTGLLANLLGRTAGAELGVIEVECRSRGDLRCRFFFGAPAALEPLHSSLAQGRDLDSALAGLGAH